MNLDKINCYGVSRADYQACQEQIARHNLQICRFMLKIFVVAMGIFALLSLAGLHPTHFLMYLTSCLANLSLLFLVKKSRISSRLLAYGTMDLMLLFAVADSSIDPKHVATTYLVFVVLVAVLLADKFWLTSAFYLAMLLVLSFCSYYFKGPIMWELDSFNGLTFTLVALALNYIVQRERIASFLLFNKYKENQRELRVQANFDHLSGVMLRSTFMDLLQKAIEQPESTDLFIGLVDIDHFKQTNDNYGHRMGDLAIQRLSQCLEKGLEVDYRDRADFAEKFDPAQDNVLARLGGDEFVFACHCPSEASCLEKMRGLQAAFAKEEITLDGQQLSQLRFSCGVIHYQNNLSNVDQLYQKADQLMYKVKKQGGGNVLLARS